MTTTDAYFDFVRLFTHALPESYRARYDAFAIADHARTVLERGQRALNAAAFRSGDARGTPVCVVADRRETLLAVLSRATVVTRLDVADGEAYTLRERHGPSGVMGLFTVRPRGSTRPLTREEKKLFLDVLAALGDSGCGQGGAPRMRSCSAAAVSLPRGQSPSTRVRFREGMDGNLCALEVETDLRSGLVQHLIEILLSERFEIVECEVESTGGRVCDRFRLVESDGASVSPSRWRDLQTRVLEAVALTSPEPGAGAGVGALA